MGDQVTMEELFEQRNKAFADARSRTIQARFEEFHLHNPQVYAELITLCRRWQSRGRKKLGIKMLWEVMRWNRMMNTAPNTDDDFKLSNDFHSRYARLIMKQESDMVDLFEIRELRSERDGQQ